jgi:hypothetical protein
MKYCNYGLYGAYYFDLVLAVIDTESTYTNLTSSSSGVYYVEGSPAENSGTSMTISNNYYYNNYGGQGGIFSFND